MESEPRIRHLGETIDKFNKGCVTYHQAMIAFKAGNSAEYETGLLNATPQIVGSLEWALKIYLRQACRGTADQAKLRQPSFHDLTTLMEQYAEPPMAPETIRQLEDYREMRNAAEHQASIPSSDYLGQAIDTIRQLMLIYLPVEENQLKPDCGSIQVGEIQSKTEAQRGRDFMADKGDTRTEIKIGNVGGDISGNIAGRDINISQTSSQPPAANEAEALAELRQLLTTVQQQLAELAAQEEVLTEVSPAAVYTAKGAEAAVKDAASKTEGEMTPDKAQSVQKSLNTATTLLTDILESARAVAEKAGKVGAAVKPIAEKLVPLVETLGHAVLLMRYWN